MILQGDNISLRKQLKNHRIILLRLADKLGSKEAAQRHLHKCLYWVGMGSNDYINNYFAPQFYATSERYTPDKFATLLMEQYRRYIMVIISNLRTQRFDLNYTINDHI